MNDDIVTVPLRAETIGDDEMRERAQALLDQMTRRRSVRHFSTEPVPPDVVETAIRIAASAPSGANLQPWTFVLVGDAAIKARIRAAAEAEEAAFYGGRAPDEWLAALAHLGTDEIKTHLTDAPWLVVVFRHRYELTPAGDRQRNYYSKESVGIATGFLIAALHQMGLVTLPHTPSPMGFLRQVLGRPVHEEAELLLPVGRPAADCRVPDITRKPLDEVLVRR